MDFVSSSEQQFVKRLIDIIDANLHDEMFGVTELAAKLGMSRITLHRKVKSVIKKSVSEFIREARLKRANELLLQKAGTVSEIAYKVGFGSVTYFDKCFHNLYGFSPGEVLKGLHTPVETLQNESIKAGLWRPSVLKVLVTSTIVLVSVVIILAIKYQKEKEPVPKSIAVLPFINDSADTTNVYFINGVTEAILNNLAAIADLRVVSRQSSEQYRNNKTKSIPEIARELGVNYIVEGSGQKTGNKIRLSIQLIDAKIDRHIFSQQYERDLQDIFNLQSEVALSVANKINAVITPEEKEQIESMPTKNIAALNQFLKGNELRQIADLEKNKELFKQAELFLRKAIELDSAYVAPYVGLGWIFNVAHGNLDSGLYYANRALHFDQYDPNALAIKGWILMMRGFYVESKKVNEQAVRLSPNNYSGFQMLATLGFHTGEYASSISYFLKALNLGISNYEKGNTLKSLCNYLYMYGFYEDGLKFAEMQIEINSDSGMYYVGSACTHLKNGNDSLAWVNSIHAQNWKAGTWWRPWYVATAMKNPKAGYAIKTLEVIKNQCSPFSVFLGYAWLINGENEKAKQEFEETIKNQLKVIEEQKEYTTGLAYLYLLDICAVMGNNKKALEYIRLFQGCRDYFITPFMLNEYKTHPRFENIRKEPEFIKFLKKHDDRVQPEMKKIEKILKNYWSEN